MDVSEFFLSTIIMQGIHKSIQLNLISVTVEVLRASREVLCNTSSQSDGNFYTEGLSESQRENPRPAHYGGSGAGKLAR